MDTGTIVGIVVAVLVIAVIAFRVMRARPPSALTAGTRRSIGEQTELPRALLPGKSTFVESIPEDAATRRARSAETVPQPPRPAPAPSPQQAPPSADQGRAPERASTEQAPKRTSVRPEAPDQVMLLRRGLASTRGGFIARLARIFSGKTEIDPAVLDQMQEVLITADVGVRTSERLLGQLRERQSRAELRDADAVWKAVREEAREILGPSPGGVRVTSRPTMILVVGVNGVGKTTTIGKLASRFKDEGRQVVLAAGDTFRAAAVVQLEVWARRVGCEIVKGKDRADPGSVIFEAAKKAQAEGADVVIAVTAGRLHTKSNLMEELKKVVRTAEKALERPIDEILLVLDATTGQNAIQQAQLFKDAIPVSGIVLTKLDGTAKGGVVLGIVDEHRIPVRYIGIGERVEDLREFDTDAFVAALFSKPEEEIAAA